ncbi:uroporphyrinogen-III synthase/uroporphyrinogen III methyltransferase / synthase [Georgenia satyanarayanai]|uniref:Uroporphyrinogen-III synthase n=1 Tax=Georgenia satyanarayanai TaxID=860221 RepID=A0A2Y9ALW6_9MICO|nr:uroporphyrinogen-III synthase [Georgenia satyanarayanai]PYF98280.1 uroporphyrinogen-III synthase/uroporphyrinogen III methyltransferase/synthase [Georgenia satyanarayanai]SSA45165.1 uroporphyrinogen-III synthase/uroporphyrinogen III methyltransferase / synthase [Georgenia satyanarayanai]
MSLAGRTLLLPRTDAADRLAHAAEEAGARTVTADLIRHETVTPTDELDAALRDAGSVDWVALTSATTVAVIAERAAALGTTTAQLLTGPRVAVVGRATGAALAAHGVGADLVPPERSSAVDLLAVWPEGSGTVLVPRSEIAAPTLVAGLRERGWQVRDVVAYRTVPVTVPDPAVAGLLDGGGVDVVVLTSGSTASAFAALYGTAAPARVCAIGTSTADAARRAGLPVHAVADHQTTAGLLEAAGLALTTGARP